MFDAYELSPIQAGMLFQVLKHDPDGNTAGYDIEQVVVRSRVSLEHAPFEDAWSLVVQRHAALSVSIDWTGDAPLQRVHSELPLLLEAFELPEDESSRAVALQAFLARDRERGFNLRVPPLVRVTLLTTNGRATDFVWTFHHLLLDGRSFARVLGEVFAAYEAMLEQRAVELPAADASHRSFVEASKRQGRAAVDAYFRALLAGRAAATPLPSLRPLQHAPPETGYSRRSRTAGSALLDAVVESARVTGTTVATYVYAAWALVLSRYTGDADVVFGAVRNGRGGFERARDAVGTFMTTLPLRVEVRDTLSVLELVQAIRAQSLELREVEHAALAEIPSLAGLPPGAPLFETLVLYDERDLLTGLSSNPVSARYVEQVELFEQPSLPLSVSVHRTEGFRLTATFDAGSLAPELVERMLEAMTFTLERLAEAPSRKLAELRAVTPSEAARLARYNDTAHEFPDNVLLHQPFERQRALRPDAIAVEFHGKRYSYAEVDRRANALCEALRARLGGPGALIGLCLHRGIDLVVATLAVSKAGAAYVPLDPRYPDERLRFMLEDARPAAIVTEPSLEQRFDDRVPKFFVTGLDAERGAPAAPAASGPPATAMCYAIYTSGSSGTPKAAVLSHRAVMNTLDWVNRTFEVRPGDRLLFVTSHSFDLSVYDLFGTLGAGATLVVADEATLNSPEKLAKALSDEKITIWNSAPAALELVLSSLVPERCTALRLILLSGDWIPLSVARFCRERLPKARFVALGGATEAAIWSNWFEVDALEPHWTSIPYGRPIQNSAYHVLDAAGRLLPSGASGELFIGGVCVADGYLNRPELTAQRFVEPLPGAGRLYRTGDRVRRFTDGTLEFLGRDDLQFKIRGFRVELAEIEAALGALPFVRRSVCATYLDAAGQNAIAAYVVSEPGGDLSESGVKRALAEVLPDFMLPSRVVFLPELPLSDNGKVDRRRLPSPLAAAVESPAEVKRAHTLTERALLSTWQRVLQRPTLSVDDDFFAMGGHSLLAVQLFNEIDRKLGVRLPLATLFEYRTVSALSAHLDELAARVSAGAVAEPASSVVPIHRGGSLPPLFCISGAGGTPFAEGRLAELLGENQPVYGLEYPYAAGRSFERLEIAEMARAFLRDIRRVQPDGPYYLSGFSAGGVVAYELARLMRAEREAVGLLVLLDAFNPALSKWSSRERFANFVRLAYHHGVNYAAYRLGLRVQLKATLAARRLFAGRAGLTPPGDMPVRGAFSTALSEYRPQSYDGDVLLIRSGAYPCPDVDYRTHESNGWGPYVQGSLEVVSLKCRHDQLLSSELERVARAMQSGLERARAASAAKPAPEAPAFAC